MSVLETFYILFKGETSDLKKATGEVQAQVRKLNLALRATVSALGTGVVLAGIKAAAEYTTELGRASDSLQVNIETLDAWGHAIKKEGGNAQAFQSSIQKLSENLNRSSEDIIRDLPKVADLFQRVGRIRAERIGKKLGFDEGLIRLLSRGRNELDEIIKRQKELGVVTKRSKEIGTEFTRQLSDTEHAFQTIGRSISDLILPDVTEYLKKLEDVLTDLNKHPDFLKGMTIALEGLAGALALFSLGTPAGRGIAAITSLIGAFAFGYEDIQALREGKESFIGKLFPGLAPGQPLSPFDDLPSPQVIPQGFNLPAPMEGTKNISINIDEVTVNTQATDADSIAESLGDSLKTHINQAFNTFTDGIRV